MFNNELWQKPAGGAGGGDFYSHQIASSIRNSSAQDGTLQWTAGTPTSSTTMTMSYWVKRYDNSAAGSLNNIFVTGTGGAAYIIIGMHANTWNMQANGGSWGAGEMKPNALYRDTSAWYHHVLRIDTTESTQADRIRQYVNGERITSYNTESLTGNLTSSESLSYINQSGVVQAWGGLSGKGHGTEGADLQMAEIVFCDGQSYGPDSFGETKNGVWIPKDPSGLTFGNNGYWLKMAAGAIGTDSSGNGNNFTVANIAAHDVMLDSPTFNSDSNGGNFATLGPLWKTDSITYTEGNLAWSGSANERGMMSNWAIPIGTKAYFEYYASAWAGGTADTQVIGINQPIADLIGGDRGGKTTGYAYQSGNGYKQILTANSAYGYSWTTGDVIGVAVDRVNHTINFYANGAWQGTFSISATMELFPFIGNGGGTNVAGGYINFGQDGTFAGTKTAGGNADDTGYGNFFYAPPTGFLAMCAGNLPVADAIDPAQTDDDFPQKLFSATIWTGNGSGRTISSGSKSDAVWIKRRNGAAAWAIQDSTRGTSAALEFNTTATEDTNFTQGVTAFGSSSFNIGTHSQVNNSSDTYVGYAIGANGGTTSTNTQGDIDSTVQVDPSGGFSIVKYTGTLSSSGEQTIGHGLSRAPSMFITKSLEKTGNWWVFSDGQTSWNYGMNLQGTGASVDKSGNGSMSAPTSTVFSTNYTDGMNENGNDLIAYCFADTEGFIKSGSYVGNGSGTDGSFVYTGFKPAFLMVKKTTANNWRVQDNTRDPYNPAYHMLLPNSSAAEEAYTDGTDYNDFLSNGFKLARGGDTANWNASGSTYVYLAFAENPFKYATAR